MMRITDSSLSLRCCRFLYIYIYIVETTQYFCLWSSQITRNPVTGQIGQFSGPNATCEPPVDDHGYAIYISVILCPNYASITAS